jgi:hypothetical protein
MLYIEHQPAETSEQIDDRPEQIGNRIRDRHYRPSPSLNPASLSSMRGGVVRPVAKSSNGGRCSSARSKRSARQHHVAQWLPASGDALILAVYALLHGALTAFRSAFNDQLTLELSQAGENRVLQTIERGVRIKPPVRGRGRSHHRHRCCLMMFRRSRELRAKRWSLVTTSTSPSPSGLEGALQQLVSH